MTTKDAPRRSGSSGLCPIVAIGCSAGGLEALEAFFAPMPRHPGVAFLVVQHLDPTQPSALAALLQPATSLPVASIEDGVRIQSDHVYVLPAGKTLTVQGDRLHTATPVDTADLRRSVDTLFRSVADARRDGAIAVVLSGMGFDGLAGARAVKDSAGLVLAQAPETAREASMPRAAIDAGVVDVVAPPEVLAARAIALAQRPPRVAVESDEVNDELDAIVALLRARGADFSLYKKSTLRRRIHRRIVLHQLPDVAAYVAHLQANPHELDLLFKELLIGVTSFFRDPAVWDHLRDVVLPELFARSPQGRTFRAWVPACSTGEEAYSLAIVFREALSRFRLPPRFALQIYATDLDADAISRARRGLFSPEIAVDVSAERLARFFVADDGGYRVAREIRDMVVFAPQNVVSDPPFTRLDIVSCRNLLIYFQPELQRKLLPLFHYALNPGGILILGSAETVGPFDHLFSAEDGKGRIFRRVEQASAAGPGLFASRLPLGGFSSADDGGPRRADALGALVDDFVRQRFTPAAVLVNADGDILYFSGRTGRYLEPAAGKVNVNLHAMARAGLREALVGVISRALRQAEPIRIEGLRIEGNNDGHVVSVVVQSLDAYPQLGGRALVVFEDSPDAGRGPGPGPSSVADAVVAELAQTREALRLTREEMQDSLEDLKSTNEELQSTNEELQSTNEELTTSKEEMQALNEELQTVNAELQSKVDDLTWERNDMTNLLNSVEVATVFLDNDMKVRRFTTHATRLFKLIPSDVGRPLSDIVNDLDYPDLIDDAREVLRTLVFRERHAGTRDGRWFRIKLMPYRTLDNVIGGIVGTFTETTELKRLEDELAVLRAGRQA